MPDDDRDRERERQKTPQQSPAERPVADRESLTITVIEPAASHDSAVRVPHEPTVRLPPRPARIPLPRWYWLFLVLAATLLYINYRVVWAERIHDWVVHRMLPPRVVRLGDSIWRHTLGGPKAADDGSGQATDGADHAK